MENKFKRKVPPQAHRLPLLNRVYYLDIKPSKKQTQLKKDLLKLGAHIEDFLSKDVNFLITDRIDATTGTHVNELARYHPDGDIWLPDTPVSGVQSPTQVHRSVQLEQDIHFPESPQTDFNRPPHNPVQSRGQALLERAVKLKAQKCGSADVLEVSRQWGIKILPLKAFLYSVNDMLKNSVQRVIFQKNTSEKEKKGSQKAFQVFNLPAPFIKVQDLKAENRPFYKQLDQQQLKYIGYLNYDWTKKRKEEICGNSLYPEISSIHSKGERDTGLAAKVLDYHKGRKVQPAVKQALTAKAKPRFCEFCGIQYSNLSKHIMTRTHARFMLEDSNFKVLDELLLKLPNGSTLRDMKKRYLKESVQDANRRHVQLNPESYRVSHPNAQLRKRAKQPSDCLVTTGRPCKVTNRDREPKQLFSDGLSEEDRSYVEASCSTIGQQFSLHLNEISQYYKQLHQSPQPSSEIPHLTKEKNGEVCCSPPSSPGKSDCEFCEKCRPPAAHQSSAGSHPDPLSQMEALNLSVKQNSSKDDWDKVSDSEANISKDTKEPSQLCYFSENARLDESGTTLMTKQEITTCLQGEENVKMMLCFSNMQFDNSKVVDESYEEDAVSAKETVDKGVSPSTQAVTVCQPTDSISTVEAPAVGILSVRKALFMSSSSPPRMRKTQGAGAVKPLSESGSEVAFSHFSAPVLDSDQTTEPFLLQQAFNSDQDSSDFLGFEETRSPSRSSAASHSTS